MQRLLVINTGGTIGMKPSASGLVPDPHFLERYCRETLFERLPQVQVQWHEWSPLIDSSQIQPEQWNQLAQCILEHRDQVDAVLLLHGTDTLAYTASALTFMLGNLTIPVIITGSMRAIQESHSDGPDNLKQSVDYCLNKGLAGVWVCFHQQLLPGSHVTKMNASQPDAFAAPVDDTRRAYGRHCPAQTLWINPASCGIDVFTFYPGASLDALYSMISNRNRALVLRSFGSGNLPQSGSLTHCLRTALAAGKTLVNISQCMASDVDMTRYQVGHQLQGMGILSTKTMTFEAVITKLMVILSLTENQEDIQTLFTQEWALEMPSQV